MATAEANGNAVARELTDNKNASAEQIRILRESAESTLADLRREFLATETELKAARNRIEVITTTLATAEANFEAATQKITDQKQSAEEQYRMLKDSSEITIADLRRELSVADGELKSLRERNESATAALATAEANFKAADERNAEQKRGYEAPLDARATKPDAFK